MIEHSHRARTGTRFHIMQYRDLALCGQYLADPVAEDHAPSANCVACGVAQAKVDAATGDEARRNAEEGRFAR